MKGLNWKVIVCVLLLMLLSGLGVGCFMSYRYASESTSRSSGRKDRDRDDDDKDDDEDDEDEDKADKDRKKKKDEDDVGSNEVIRHLKQYIPADAEILEDASSISDLLEEGAEEGSWEGDITYNTLLGFENMTMKDLEVLKGDSVDPEELEKLYAFKEEINRPYSMWMDFYSDGEIIVVLSDDADSIDSELPKNTKISELQDGTFYIHGKDINGTSTYTFSVYGMLCEDDLGKIIIGSIEMESETFDLGKIEELPFFEPKVEGHFTLRPAW